MGREGTAPGLGPNLKVKNTFIDVKTVSIDDDVEVEDLPYVDDQRRLRQVSEPAILFARQMSAPSPWRTGAETRVAPQLPEMPRVSFEDKDADIESPNWILDRETTETSWNASFIGRQVTEQTWPSWGLPLGQNPVASVAAAAAAAGLVDAEPLLTQQVEALAASNIWMYSLPGLVTELANVSMLSEEVQRQMPQTSLPGPPQSNAAAVAQQMDRLQQTAAAAAAVSSLSASLAAASWSANPSVAAAVAGLSQQPQVALAPPPPSQLPEQRVAQSQQAPMPSTIIPADWENVTTVMMRNLPNKYSQHMLLEELNQEGFLGTFDFMYLPIDPETNANRGYAFINFTEPSFAWMLKLAYEGRKMGRFNSDKVVSIAPAALQGFEANYAHYSTARVNRGDPSARPLFLREPSTQQSRPDAGRRRGGRRSQGSLIDLAAKQQQGPRTGQGQERGHGQGGQFAAPCDPSAYIGLRGHQEAVNARTGPLRPGPTDKTAGMPGSMPGPHQPPLPQHLLAKAAPVPRHCPFCGGETQPEFRFCQFCGAALNALDPSMAVPIGKVAGA